MIDEPKSGQAGKTLEQIAYEEWCAYVHPSGGIPWERLGMQLGWENIAQTVAAAAVEKFRTSDAFHAHVDAVARNIIAAAVREKDEEIARLQKPWSVVMALGLGGDGYEQVDCNILDVGHADRILIVETPPEVKASLIALRQKNERIKVLEEALSGLIAMCLHFETYTNQRRFAFEKARAALTSNQTKDSN